MSHNLERKRERNRAYYHAHKEERRLYNQKYWQRIRNLPETKEKRRIWLEANKSRIKMYEVVYQQFYDNLPMSFEKKKNTRLKREYGIDLTTYESMLSSQNNVCKICSGVNKSGMALAVDHDHKTGQVRGLLCTRCNNQLGWFEMFSTEIFSYLKDQEKAQ